MRWRLRKTAKENLVTALAAEENRESGDGRLLRRKTKKKKKGKEGGLQGMKEKHSKRKEGFGGRLREKSEEEK